MASSENPTKTEIGENIHALRKVSGITQAELADRLTAAIGKPVSVATVGAWERGERTIPGEELYPLAQVLNTSLENLFVYNRVSAFDYDVKAFIAAVKSLPAEDKHILQYMLTRWAGNKHVMLQLAAMLMTVSKREQGDMIGMAAMLYQQKERGGLTVDLEAVESESVRLLKIRE